MLMKYQMIHHEYTRSAGRSRSDAGCFQNAQSIFPLLWGLSQQFDHLAALIRIGSNARLEVRERMKRSTA